MLLLPSLLAIFFLLAFFNVRHLQHSRGNLIIEGSIGDPETLNPILSTTAGAGDIMAFIGGALLSRDENLNRIGDLAETWTVTQRTWLYFTDPAAAATALAALQADRSFALAAKLTNSHLDGRALIMDFATAGRSYQDALFKLLPRDKTLPFHQISISLEPKTAFADGTKVSYEHANRRILDCLAADKLSEYYIYTWQNTSLDFEIMATGPAEQIRKSIQRALTSPDGKPLGTVGRIKTDPTRDEPIITFHIRRGVRWHDGHQFTAQDAAFTYRMLMDENVASPRRADYELIRKIDVPDPYTFVVTYKEPYSSCLNSWSSNNLLPRHLLQGKTKNQWTEIYDMAPIGTGPYKFKRWESNNYIELVRNDDYWEGPPHIETYRIQFLPDPFTQQLAFESRQIDYVAAPPYAMGRFSHDPRYAVHPRNAGAYSYIGWNLKRSLFQDVRVRLALAHAIDTDEIIKYVLYGYGDRSRGIYPNHFPFANNQIAPISYNPQLAKELLAQAGWVDSDGDGILDKDGRPFRFTLISNQGNNIRKDIATLAQAAYKKIGIAVDVHIYEWTVFITKHIDTREFDACVLGWRLPLDPDSYQIWHSSQIDSPGLNFVSYNNPHADRFIELIRTEFDENKQKSYCQRLQKIIYDDQPYLFLYVPQSTPVMHIDAFRVRRPVVDPDGRRQWLEEPVGLHRKVGFRRFQTWWYRPSLAPI